MAQAEQTRIITQIRAADLVVGDRIHCLELSDGSEAERRHVVGPLGVRIGRTPPATIVLSDSEISREHCEVMLTDAGLIVTDRGSTNGTFVDGTRVRTRAPLPVGSILQVGRRALRHEVRSRAEYDQFAELDRELERAGAYIQALLPPPSREGPVRTDWVHVPSVRLGGDAFGYGQLDERTFVGYLIDVAGHGPGAAMLAVSVMNQLRQRALPGADMKRPAEVLATLNRLFPMDEHAGLYFTMWYGVYDVATRRLDYAAAGHHPALLMTPGSPSAVPVGNRNVMIGAVAGMRYREDTMTVPAGSSLYVFSDGVFEFTDCDGRQRGFADFQRMVEQRPGVGGASEGQRLFDATRGAAKPGQLEDDFSLVVLSFD